MTAVLLQLLGRRCKARLIRRCVLRRGSHRHHIDGRGDIFLVAP